MNVYVKHFPPAFNKISVKIPKSIILNVNFLTLLNYKETIKNTKSVLKFLQIKQKMIDIPLYHS